MLTIISECIEQPILFLKYLAGDKLLLLLSTIFIQKGLHIPDIADLLAGFYVEGYSINAQSHISCMADCFMGLGSYSDAP
jgi:hypothetical protein